MKNPNDFIGQVGLKGTPQLVGNYEPQPGADPVFSSLGFKTVAGVPLKNEAGDVEAVLFIGDCDTCERLAETDMEVLEYFGAQAAIALQTSRLLNQEQRVYGKLTTLNRISDYFQA